MKEGTIAVLVLLACAAAPARQNPQGATPGFTVDREKREVLIPCRIAPRKLPTLPEIYPIEVIATYPAPKGQKAHETMVTFDARPQEIHKALEGLGLKAGKPVRGDAGVVTGAELDVLLEITEKGGAKKRIPIESALVDRKTGRTFPSLTWHFTGSSVKQPDPAKPDQVYSADVAGTLIGIYPVTDELVIQSNLTMKEEGAIKIEVGKGLLPPEGTGAMLVIRPATPRSGPAASALPPRAAAEAEVLSLANRISVTAAHPGPVAIPALPPAPVADPFRHRRDIVPVRGTPEEARPVALPVPPLPR